MHQTLVDPVGHATNGRIEVPAGCNPTDKRGVFNCLQQAGFKQFVKYQPASRYWHFQCTEAALFVALAAILISVAVTYTLRHDA
jgi:hypothetical protein